MARKTRPKLSNQKHKNLKRPRSWHRSCLKSVEQIAQELGVPHKQRKEPYEHRKRPG